MNQYVIVSRAIWLLPSLRELSIVHTNKKERKKKRPADASDKKEKGEIFESSSLYHSRMILDELVTINGNNFNFKRYGNLKYSDDR